MGKCFLLGSVVVTTLMTLGDCSISDSYCCTSNSQCVSVHGKESFCTTLECGKCEIPEQPLQLSAITWEDATVGKSFKVELEASGGFPPYDWGGGLAKLDNENKLGWLILEKDENDNSKAWLRNDPNNGQPLLPSKPTTLNDTLAIKVTVKDDTRHMTDSKKVDNSVVTFTHDIKINDCKPLCVVNGPTKCDLGTLYHCETYFGDCTKWIETKGQCSTKMCQTKGPNANVSCCDNPCGNSTLTRCNNGYIEKCSEDELGCFIWKQQNQCPNQTNCKSDGSSCENCKNGCDKSGDRLCSDDHNTWKICTIDMNLCLNWGDPQPSCNGHGTCMNSGGVVACNCNTGWEGDNCDQCVVNISLNATVNPMPVGTSTTLNWNSSCASSCVASGGWSGEKNASFGSESQSPISDTTYNLSCSNNAKTDMKSVTVIVKQWSNVTCNLGNNGQSCNDWLMSTSCGQAGLAGTAPQVVQTYTVNGQTNYYPGECIYALYCDYPTIPWSYLHCPADATAPNGQPGCENICMYFSGFKPVGDNKDNGGGSVELYTQTRH